MLAAINYIIMFTFLKVKNNLQETQSKVENSKAEITRIHNELTPMEVRVEVGRKR